MRAEKPHIGWSGVPFMNRITGFSSMAAWIWSRSRVGRLVAHASALRSVLVWIDSAWMRSPTSGPNTS